MAIAIRVIVRQGVAVHVHDPGAVRIRAAVSVEVSTSVSEAESVAASSSVPPEEPQPARIRARIVMDERCRVSFMGREYSREASVDNRQRRMMSFDEVALRDYQVMSGDG